MTRAPKVFAWSDGFHRYTVAATSRAKAMAAWETDRDLFKEGVAREITEGPDVEAALAAPGAVIRRAESGLQAAVGRLPGPRKAKPSAKAVVKRQLEATRAALGEADREYQAARDDIDARRKQLDAEAADLRRNHERRRAALDRDVSRLETKLAET